MTSPILTLTTDFGLSDHFVGVMKGVILGICPRSLVVDISHNVTPFEVTEAAFLLAQSYSYFPKKTVHVAVVDPGVGTARRPILVEAAGQYFIGPDNGVFSLVCGREKHRVREITAVKYFRQHVSQTFHGRDIFAPVAAHLANGISAAAMGRRIDNYLRSNFDKPERTGRRVWTGLVLKIDRFGNLTTNFQPAELPDLLTHRFEMQVGIQRLHRLASIYAEGTPGEPFLILGSSGYFEVALNQGSAARTLGVGAGAPLELTVY